MSNATFSPEITAKAQQMWAKQEAGTPAWKRLSKGARAARFCIACLLGFLS
jgi:hypothetical protein